MNLEPTSYQQDLERSDRSIDDTLELLPLESLEKALESAPDDTASAFEEKQHCYDALRAAHQARNSKNSNAFETAKIYVRTWLAACEVI